MKLRLKDAYSDHKDKSAGKGKRSIGVIRSSRVRTFLVFVLLAFIFWLLQSMQNDVVRRVHVPLAYDTLSMSKGFSERIPESVELEVKDKRIEHIRYALSGFDTIRLRIIQGSGGRDFLGISTSDLSEALNERLSSSAEILQQSIRELRIALYQRVSRQLPARLVRSVHPEAGYTVGAPIYSPETVTVYGERTALDSLAYVPLIIEQDSAMRYRTSLDLSLPPQLPQGVYCDVKSIQVTIPIEELTEKSFELPIIVRNPPAGYKLTPLPSTATVRLTIPRSRHNELVETDVELSVDYADAVQPAGADNSGATHQLQIRLSKQPKWLISYRLQPEAVQYVLESN